MIYLFYRALITTIYLLSGAGAGARAGAGAGANIDFVHHLAELLLTC